MGTTYTNTEHAMMNKYALQQAAYVKGFSHYLFANSSDGWCVVVEREGVEIEFYRFNELLDWAGV